MQYSMRRFVLSQVTVVLALTGAPALAAGLFKPYVSAQYEHDSNVFAGPSNDLSITDPHLPRISDDIQTYVAGFTSRIGTEREHLRFTAEGRRMEYDKLDHLTHNEYLLGAGLDWHLLTRFDGSLDISREHRMASLADRVGQTALAINTDTQGIGKVNIQLAPRWRLETTVLKHQLDTPLDGYPDYSLHETISIGELNYQGTKRFSYGVRADYGEGVFYSGPFDSDYDQLSLRLSARYATGSSTLIGNAGRTRRSQNGVEGVHANTGQLQYTYKFTGKTSATVGYTRLVNNYIVASDAELDSAWNAGLTWQITGKTGVGVSYMQTHSRFFAQVSEPSLYGRVDDYGVSTLDLTWAALRWLKLRAFAHYQDRESNRTLYTFNSATVGLQIEAKVP